MRVSKLMLGFICLLCFQAVNAQSTVECEQLLKKEITVADFNEDIETFFLNVKKLITCKFEDIDVQIMIGPDKNFPFIAQQFVSIVGDMDETKYTFQDLLNKLIFLKNSPEYAEVREIVGAQNLILGKEISITNWEVDQKLLAKMGLSETEVKDILLLANLNEGKKYSEIFLMYSDTLAAERERKQLEWQKVSAEYKANNPGTDILVEGLFAYEIYEDGLRKSKDTNKPLLLYFNGYACVNARKMEQFILTEHHIQEYIIENFVLVNLLVDDKRKLEDGQIFYSEVLSRDITTVGQKNSEFQIRQFKANSQPLFVIVGTDEQEVSRIGYVTEESEFIEFLKSK